VPLEVQWWDEEQINLVPTWRFEGQNAVAERCAECEADKDYKSVESDADAEWQGRECEV